MTDYSFNDLIVTKTGGITTVTLNRPERLNALDRSMNREILRFLKEVTTDLETKVVILRGEGRAFSAGGDLVDHAQFGPGDFEREMHLHYEIMFAILDCSKPVICALHGNAVAWSATLALFCDIIIADEKARLSDPHVALGLSTGDGGGVIWPQLAGYPRAKLALMTGEPISGRTAAEWGMVSEAVPFEQLHDRVMEIATRIASMPQLAMSYTKKSINIPLKNLVQSMMEGCIAYELVTEMSPEHRQAQDDFVEQSKARATLKAANRHG